MPIAAYDFLAPQRIVFGWGRRRELGALVQNLGRRAFIVSGSRTLERSPLFSELLDSLHAAGLEAIPVATISREPLVEDVDQLTARLRDLSAGRDSDRGDVVIAVGGGSAIDLAKAAAAVITNPISSTVRDFLEGVGRGCRIEQAPLRFVALPTTGGTGTEATKNAVISNLDPPFKKSLRSDLMIPRIVLVDPELSVSVSPEVTAWTGLDAITQLIESYTTRHARPIPQGLALHGLELALPALPRAVRDGGDRPAREAMAHAALLSGMALANSGLGFAHGVAAALGVHCQVPHGLACAVLLPIALRVNKVVRQPELARLGVLATDRTWPTDEAAAAAFIEHVDDLLAELRIPRQLSALGVRAEQLDELVPASRGNSMNGNPRDVSDDELRSLLEEWY